MTAVGTNVGKWVAIRKSLRVIGIAVELREESGGSLAGFRESSTATFGSGSTRTLRGLEDCQADREALECA